MNTYDANGYTSFAEAGIDIQLLKSLELSLKGHYEYFDFVIPLKREGLFGGMVGLKYCL